jgi:adenosyl cobinamide kinase/adenosyl cobinamide phosphate guanylyltransferase
MILIVGGYASGKRTYVQETYGYGREDMADGMLNSRPVLFNLQNLVAGESEEASEGADLLGELLKKEIVICNEVGSGVIPVDQRERDMREATGRLCIALAREAKKVIRIVCGLPVVLKE